MASFRPATLILACVVLSLESCEAQLPHFFPEKLDDAAQVKKALMERCSKVCLLFSAAFQSFGVCLQLVWLSKQKRLSVIGDLVNSET